MRQNCHDASWRVERILAKLEEGGSLDTTITSIELGDARKELHLLMRSIEHIERHCEVVSSNDSELLALHFPAVRTLAKERACPGRRPVPR